MAGIPARARTAFTAHNATVTHDLALVTWYAGGLQAIDISDPAQPFQLAELRPDALPHVTTEDPGLGGNTTEMWSYPIIDDGLIYVVDIDLGLYILRYTGPHAGEVSKAPFVEGNSAPSRYTAAAPVIKRPAAVAAKIAALRAPRLVEDTIPVVDRHGHVMRFIC